MFTCYYASVRAGFQASINTNFVLKYIYFTEKMREINDPIFLMLCRVVRNDEKYAVQLKKS